MSIIGAVFMLPAYRLADGDPATRARVASRIRADFAAALAADAGPGRALRLTDSTTGASCEMARAQVRHSQDVQKLREMRERLS